MNTIKKIVKQSTCRERAVFLLTDLFLAALCALGMQVSFNGDVWGTPEENFLRPLTLLTLGRFVLFLLLGGAVLLALLYLNHIYRRCPVEGGHRKPEVPFIKGAGRHSRKILLAAGNIMGRKRLFYFLSLALLLLAWLPYVLAYFPGGVYVDTFSSIISAYDMDGHGMALLNNHHPILYTLLWRGAILFGRLFGQGLAFASGTFLACQYLAMGAVLAYLILWVRERGLGTGLTLALQAFLMFFPLFPLYVVSLWKDTPFSLVLLLFSLCLGDLAFDGAGRLLREPGYLARFSILGFLTAFTRNNGKYIVFLAMAVLLLMQARKLLACWKAALSFLLLAALVTVVQGPVYEKMNYNIDTMVESLGIPLQQIAYLVYYDYELTEEEEAYIGAIVSEQSIKEQYRPCVFDSIKWYAPDFKGTVIEEDPGAFLRCWLSLMARHPLGGTRAYLLATAGFWAPSVAGSAGYAQTWMWENQYGLEGRDLLEELTGHTVRGWADSLEPVSSAVFLLALAMGAFVPLMRRDHGKLLLLLPAAACWLTVMAATPIACSLRYVYILVLAVPLDVLLVCVSGERKETGKRDGEGYHG